MVARQQKLVIIMDYYKFYQLCQVCVCAYDFVVPIDNVNGSAGRKVRVVLSSCHCIIILTRSITVLRMRMHSCVDYT